MDVRYEKKSKLKPNIRKLFGCGQVFFIDGIHNVFACRAKVRYLTEGEESLEQIAARYPKGTKHKKAERTHSTFYDFLMKILCETCPFCSFDYRPFHKTLTRSSAFVNWSSVRFIKRTVLKVRKNCLKMKNFKKGKRSICSQKEGQEYILQAPFTKHSV